MPLEIHRGQQPCPRRARREGHTRALPSTHPNDTGPRVSLPVTLAATQGELGASTAAPPQPQATHGETTSPGHPCSSLWVKGEGAGPGVGPGWQAWEAGAQRTWVSEPVPTQ